MHRAAVAELETGRIAKVLKSSEYAGRWSKLVEFAGSDAAHLLKLVCQLAPPERISELRDLETEQCKRGAGFLGMLPDQIPESLDVPRDLEVSLDAAIQLAQVRDANLAALAETMPDYPLVFAGNTFEPAPRNAVPTSWSLDIDASAILAALDLFGTDEPDSDSAASIAAMPAFAEMMRHRRELGYVPEPLIDEDGLAWCLVHAASHDPIDELWKWLHPQNLFDLSDLYAYRTEYRRLIDSLLQDDGLASHILSRIAPYAPADVVFQDRLSFAVGWGIRGWATQATGGMNIEHAKDNFERMLPTLVHETFHRLQTAIALSNPEIDDLGFDRITSYPFESEADGLLYRALCYVMLEGSATYAQAPRFSASWKADTKAGLDLLERIRAIDPSPDASDACDELLNEGLRSNGPFYGFGALLSHAIVEDGGPSQLGVALQRGAPSFVEHGIASLGRPIVALPEDLATRIAHLRAAVERDI
jgi:hypothetical protein